MATGTARTTVDQAIEKFQRFDQDRNGSIEPHELSAILKGCDSQWTDAKIENLMNTLDKNGDGSIQLEEFMAWALRGQEEPEFRKQMGFAKPKVTWKRFDMQATYNHEVKTVQGVHPSHKARVLFERIAVQFALAPSELIICFGTSRRQISYGSVKQEENLSDFGFASYCTPDADIPMLVVKTKESLDDIICECHGIRDTNDECLKDMWFWPALEAKGRRARCLGDSDENPDRENECKIELLRKEPPKKEYGDDEYIETQYPCIVFYVGDREKPNALYGKHVFSLGGEFPGEEAGLPKRWSNETSIAGYMDTADGNAMLQGLRSEAIQNADQMMKDAGEKNDASMATQAATLRQSALTGVKVRPLSKAERRTIHEAVAPFLMRIWIKISETGKIRDDGNYVSNLRKDGFEIVKPRDINPDSDGGKRTANTILGVPNSERLRMFKALQLLEVDARD